MALKLCQCCASQKDLDILTARYANILETIFSLKISEATSSYVCIDCISFLIDTSIFQMKIERTQKAIQAKTFELEAKKQNITIRRISNRPLGCTTKLKYTNKNVTNSNIIASPAPMISIKLEDSDSKHFDNDNNDTSSHPVENETPTQYAQGRIAVNDVFNQLDAESLVCHICHEKQTTFTLLSRHMNVHFPNHVCETCGKGFMTQSRLNVHVKIHNPVPQKCDECDLTFSNVNSLSSHRQAKHKPQKPNKCHICGERFTYRYNKIKHMAVAHGHTDKNYKCQECPMTFMTASCRSAHFAKKHNLIHKHMCEVCGKSFSNRESLKGHMTSHTTERPFQCTQCPKAYPRKKTLREHMRIHDNDKRFSCEICGRLFTQKCSLKGHMKVHEKKGDYSAECENAVSDLLCSQLEMENSV